MLILQLHLRLICGAYGLPEAMRTACDAQQDDAGELEMRIGST